MSAVIHGSVMIGRIHEQGRLDLVKQWPVKAGQTMGRGKFFTQFYYSFITTVVSVGKLAS